MNTTANGNNNNKQVQIQFLCKKLPTELCNIILEYHGYYKNRNGRWMARIDMDKYRVLYDIPRINPVPPGEYMQMFDNRIQRIRLRGGCQCNFMRTVQATETTSKKTLAYLISNFMYENGIRWIINVREMEYSVGPKRILKNGRIEWKHKYKTEYLYEYMPTTTTASVQPVQTL
jgi:hypothetical protein